MSIKEQSMEDQNNFNKLISFIDFSATDYSVKEYFNSIFEFLSNSNEKMDFLTFYNYLSLPFFISEKIFSSFTSNQHLTQKEFVNGLYNLYDLNIEQKIKFVFSLFNINKDNYIYYDDVKLLLIHFKSLGNCIHEEEDNSYITSIVNALFVDKTKIDYLLFNHHIHKINSDLFYVIIFILMKFRTIDENVIHHLSNIFSNKNNVLINKLIGHKEIIYPTHAFYEFLYRNFDAFLFQIDDEDFIELKDFEKDVQSTLCLKNKKEIRIESNINYFDSDSTTSSFQGSNGCVDSFLCYNEKEEQFHLDIVYKTIFIYKRSHQVNCIVSIIPISQVYIHCVKGRNLNGVELTSTIKNTKKSTLLFFVSTEDIDKFNKIIINITKYRDISLHYEQKKQIELGVFTGINKENKNKVVIKKVTKDYKSIEDLRLAYSEKDISIFLMKNSKLGIVKVIDIYEDEDMIYIIQEYIPQTLKEFILSNDNNISYSIINNIFSQLIVSLIFLHSNGIVHRDIKIENVLIKKINHNKYQSKIIDFGISRVLSKNESLQAKYGTFANLPPEIIKNEEYTHNIDIWNLGIIGFFMLYKKHPFNSIKKKELEKKIINEEIVFDKSNEVNKNLVMIVEKCLERNKYIRPDSDELIKYIDYL